MVAIKGMEMPSCCNMCDFRKSDPFSGEVYCNRLSSNENIIIYEDERLDNCPLVEIVVTPHNNIEILDVKKLNSLFPKNKQVEKTEWTSKINFNKAD
jgi:hypothetical protein